MSAPTMPWSPDLALRTVLQEQLRSSYYAVCGYADTDTEANPPRHSRLPSQLACRTRDAPPHPANWHGLGASPRTETAQSHHTPSAKPLARKS
jgi:hypothetical protein